jgi:single-strand DNA-binding protein
MNTVILSGRVGADSELKTTRNGKPYTQFSVAVNRKSPTGDVSASWFDVTWFSDHARILSKGDYVVVYGSLTQETWTDKSGQKRYAVKVIANQVVVAGKTLASDAPPQSSFEDDVSW